MSPAAGNAHTVNRLHPPQKEAGFDWMKEVRNLPMEQLRALGIVVKGELGKQD